jgi:hypothetical protein
MTEVGDDQVLEPDAEVGALQAQLDRARRALMPFGWSIRLTDSGTWFAWCRGRTRHMRSNDELHAFIRGLKGPAQ